MAARRRGWLLRGSWSTAAFALLLAARTQPAARADAPTEASAEARADAPSAVSVTVYRDPYRGSGSIELDRLAGFALVSESRTVHLPEGESRLRFEGVADGIEPESAIVTGLGDELIEKNRDASVLSPSALVAAAVGNAVMLTRVNPGTGRVERLPGTLLSDAEGGVVFKSAQGIEALRCSGLPEAIRFAGREGLGAQPTLSVKVRARRAMTATATLSYLARGFDWGADYSATLSPDGRSMDLGAWVTLANGNGTGFAEAHTQVVAGRVNRVGGEVEPIDIGGPIIANCWPRGSTSDVAAPVQLQRAPSGMDAVAITQTVGMTAARAMAAPLLAQTVEQETLGDLKLYRVPERTTLAARQSKQVRLLDRSGIPVTIVYALDLDSRAVELHLRASRSLRTTNDAAHRLGLPLPAGRVQVYGVRGERLLEHQAVLRDLAVDEEVELDLGPSADVSVAAFREGDSHRVDISNARASVIWFELTLRLPDGARLAAADHKAEAKNGRPMFRLTVPAQGSAAIAYATQGGR